jgi:hypothetical protein
MQVPQLRTGDNLGMFFVEVHVVSDYKCHRCFLGCDQETKQKPCSHCKVRGTKKKGAKKHDLTYIMKQLKEREGPMDARDDLTPIFDIPISRYHACGLHCHHRVVEWLLYQAMNTVYMRQCGTPDLKAQQAADMTEILRLLNEANVNGGKCEFREDPKNKSSVYNKLAKIPLNGPECMRVLALAEQIAAISERGNSADRKQKVADLWAEWIVVHENLQKWCFSDEELQAAKAGGVAFSQHYTDVYSARMVRVPDYLHLLCYHADWFWGVDESGHFRGPPAWWSTTALEKSHSLHKRKLRYKTLHGMPFKVTNSRGIVETITHAPHIYQLFQWQFREYVWRWNDRLVVETFKRTITLTDIRMIYKCSDLRTTRDDPLTEAEICHFLSFPRGCSVHLIGRGRLNWIKAPRNDPNGVFLTAPVHVTVSSANVAARNHVERHNDMIRGDGRVVDNLLEVRVMCKRARAQFTLPAATQEAIRAQQGQKRVKLGDELTAGLDFSFMST